MLKIEDLSTWLKASPRSITTPIRLTMLPDTPDTVIALSDYGGYPLEIEEAFDVPTFQARCRGVTAVVARDLAHQIDQVMLESVYRPFTLGSGGGAKRVIDVGRVGGAPAYLATDDRGRTEYVCNYFLRIER